MKKPVLGLKDIHIVINCNTNNAKCFVAGGEQRWNVPCHTEGLSRDTEAWGGDTPAALWEATAVEHIPDNDPEAPSFGRRAVTLVCQENIKRGAVGIMLHGGGRALPDPLAPRQGWTHTLGCGRFQNEDLEKTVCPSIEYTFKRGGRVWVSTVR